MLCGMGVSAVQGCDACKMLSLQSAKEQLPFLQSSGWLQLKLFENNTWYILSAYQYILSAYLVCTKYIPWIMVCAALVQDTVLVVPQYPYCIEEDLHDVDLEDCWTALPRLFFRCHLCPKG